MHSLQMNDINIFSDLLYHCEHMLCSWISVTSLIDDDDDGGGDDDNDDNDDDGDDSDEVDDKP
jgi:hypothetical protein